MTCDRSRTAVLWLKDGAQHEIPENDWPYYLSPANDEVAAQRWSRATGLTVTIRTEIQTTVEAPDAS